MKWTVTKKRNKKVEPLLKVSKSFLPPRHICKCPNRGRARYVQIRKLNIFSLKRLDKSTKCP